MKLTGTNSSIGLIILITHIHLTRSDELDLSHAPYRTFGAGAATARRATGDGQVGLAGKCTQDRSSPTIKTNNSSFFILLRFADLVVTAGWLHPIPFRTRP
jgi:hypothetical protein